MPPARKRGSQEQGRHLYNAPRSQARQPGTGATTTSLHSLSLSLWVRPTRRAGMQTEADDNDEPTWLVVVRCLKEKEEETHPVSQLQARGWVIVVVVVGADGGR